MAHLRHRLAPDDTPDIQKRPDRYGALLYIARAWAVLGGDSGDFE